MGSSLLSLLVTDANHLNLNVIIHQSERKEKILTKSKVKYVIISPLPKYNIMVLIVMKKWNLDKLRKKELVFMVFLSFFFFFYFIFLFFACVLQQSMVQLHTVTSSSFRDNPWYIWGMPFNQKRNRSMIISITN